MKLHLILGNAIPIPENFPNPVCGVINQPLIGSTSNNISISSSEAERGFSQINITMTSERTKLIINNVSALSLISMNGAPLCALTTWQRCHGLATDNKSHKVTLIKLDDLSSIQKRFVIKS